MPTATPEAELEAMKIKERLIQCQVQKDILLQGERERNRAAANSREEKDKLEKEIQQAQLEQHALEDKQRKLQQEQKEAKGKQREPASSSTGQGDGRKSGSMHPTPGSAYQAMSPASTSSSNWLPSSAPDLQWTVLLDSGFYPGPHNFESPHHDEDYTCSYCGSTAPVLTPCWGNPKPPSHNRKSC